MLASKGPALLRHPFRNYRMMPVLFDYRLSIVWSFLYWMSLGAVPADRVLRRGQGQDWERFWHNWYMVGIFVALQMIVGLVQLTTASVYNDGGRTLKYIVFAPWYMLVYWMVNTWTVVWETVPTVGKVWARDGGAPGSRPSGRAVCRASAEGPGRGPA